MLGVLNKVFDPNKRDLKRLEKTADRVEALVLVNLQLFDVQPDEGNDFKDIIVVLEPLLCGCQLCGYTLRSSTLQGNKPGDITMSTVHRSNNARLVGCLNLASASCKACRLSGAIFNNS